jgi:HEAT repeat protein
MTTSVLLVAMLVQLGILGSGVVLLSVLHVTAGRRERTARAVRERLEPLLLAWLSAAEDDRAHLARFRVALRETSEPLALRFVATAAAARLSPARRAALGRAIREERWVAHVLAGLASRRWWERLGGARLLAVVVTPDDVDRVRALLADPVAAVRLAAADVIPPLLGVGVPGAAAPDVALALVDALLDALPSHRRLVGAYHIDVLARLGPPAAQRVAARIDALQRASAMSSGATSVDDAARMARELVVWVDVADALGDQALLERVRALVPDADVEIRIHAARALRRLYSERGLETLNSLLVDADWRVRAQAARSLGALGARASVPALAAAVTDAAWWVRYRAALALAQLGEPGRTALRALSTGPDRMARDMSALVSGLSAGMVAELGEG